MMLTYGVGTEPLQALLTAEHKAAGLELREDDHCVYLYRRGEFVAAFNAAKVTVATIRETADWAMRE